jgi:RimJ/RimL family protein N-acetyltransferase
MKTDTFDLPVHSESEISARLAQLKLRIAGRLELGLYSSFMRYGLSRDLNLPFEKPKAKIPIAIRPMIADDIGSLLPLDNSENDHREKLEIAWRRAFLEKRPQGCFVAIDVRNETPCYMQWLFSSKDNLFIQRLRGFPKLEPQEALLENAYTPPKYRGLGIMSAAMAIIAERAADFGARHVLTFVDEHNVASLKGCQRAGFYPYILHHRLQRVFGLFRTDEFEKLPDTDPRRDLRF